MDTIPLTKRRPLEENRQLQICEASETNERPDNLAKRNGGFKTIDEDEKLKIFTTSHYEFLHLNFARQPTMDFEIQLFFILKDGL